MPKIRADKHVNTNTKQPKANLNIRTRSQWRLCLAVNSSLRMKFPRDLPDNRWDIAPCQGSGQFVFFIDPSSHKCCRFRGFSGHRWFGTLLFPGVAPRHRLGWCGCRLLFGRRDRFLYCFGGISLQILRKNREINRLK